MDQDRWKVAGAGTGASGEDSEAPSRTSSGSSDPCANNCGFLGTLFRMNYCSACYTEIVLRGKHPLPSMLSSSSVSGSMKPSVGQGAISLHLACKPRVPKASLEAPSENMSPPADEARMVASPANYAKMVADPPLNRCSSCHKRVGMNGFNCRCGLLFCASHRYPDKHPCPFDYKAAGRVAIARANPVVKAEKMNKI